MLGKSLTLLRFAVKCLFCGRIGVLGLALSNICCKAKDLVMSIPSHLLNSGQIVLVIRRSCLPSLLVHAVFAICDRLLNVGILHRYLLQLFMFSGSSLALNSDPLQFELILALALFALPLLGFSFGQLFLLVGLALLSHLLTLLLVLLPFFLLFHGSLSHSILLLATRGFLGSPSSVLLLIFFSFTLSFGFFTLGCQPFHGVSAVNIFLLCLLLGSLSRLDLSLQGEALLVGLPPRFHQFELFLHFSVFLVSNGLLLLLTLSCRATLLCCLHCALLLSPTLCGLFCFHLF